jgi:phage terminase large subunit GpA-like protein
MYDWMHYVNDYIEANPLNQPRKEPEHKAFVNLCLGETYEVSAESPKANSIQKNQRPYDVGTIPEKMSINDGNGTIILLTCAVDMNGTIEDGRLDYEIVAWAESGATYSILHGSIGTFIPRENTLKHKVDRERWTYEENKENSVWPALDEVLSRAFKTDTDREMRVFMAGLDCGNFKNYAYSYLDKTNKMVVGLKGTRADKYIQFGADVSIFKHSQERSNLYILQVGLIKDSLSDYMNLKWTERDGDQPSNFMNFPQSSNGLYGFSNFFEHFESEHRVIETKGGTGIAARWVKKSSNSQNHMWDTRVYNIAMREIILDNIGKQLKRKPFTWRDYADIMAG